MPALCVSLPLALPAGGSDRTAGVDCGTGRCASSPSFSGRVPTRACLNSPRPVPAFLVASSVHGISTDPTLKRRSRQGLGPGQKKPSDARDVHLSVVQEEVQGPAVAMRPLAGSTWKVTLDVGRERNTWMPQTWAVSGRRVEIPLALQLASDGTVVCLGIGAFMSELKVGKGEWKMDNGTLRFSLDISGFERGDVSLPAGDVHFSIPAWGSILSAKGGMLTIRQRRWVVRRESRIVGRFTAEPLEALGDDLAAALPPVRVSQGTWDGRVYERSEKAPAPLP